jgi:succinate dehydrogenase hydrophobic anchor subunit
MNYTFVAVSLYVLMRGLQVLLEDYKDKDKARMAIKIVAALLVYAAFASLVVWYVDINLLGFDSDK